MGHRQMKKLALIAFSLLLLVPASQVFASTYNPTTVGPVVNDNIIQLEFATFTVSAESSVQLVGVRLSMEAITAAQAQNLIVSLQSPSSTLVRLHSFTGGTASTIEDVLYLGNLNDCPPADTCVVVDGPGAMVDFIAEDPNGTWRLVGASERGPGGGSGNPDFTVYVNGDTASWGTAIGTQLLINDALAGAPVGSISIPIDTTSLLLADTQSFSWMIPVVLSVLGIGLFVVSRNQFR